jgi:hypothetical protein
MDPLRGLPGVQGGLVVQERRGGGSKQQADAFRQALQQQAGGERSGEPLGQAPMRSRLQATAVSGRKDEGTARHVDVIA